LWGKALDLVPHVQAADCVTEVDLVANAFPSSTSAWYVKEYPSASSFMAPVLLTCFVWDGVSPSPSIPADEIAELINCGIKYDSGVPGY